MTESNAQVRVPNSLRGKSFSVISLGACNMSCPYCFLGGNLHRNGMTFPNTKNVDIKEVFAFIDEQIEKNNPLKISGGEPTVMQSTALRIAKYIKTKGGYLCLDTSGWNPERSFQFRSYIDQVAIDLKGPKRYVCKLTKLNIDESFYNPLKTINLYRNEAETIEIRTVVFPFTTIDDLIEIAQLIPNNAFWNLRKFVSDWTPFDTNSNSDLDIVAKDGPALIDYPKWLTAGNENNMEKLIQQLLVSVPTLRGRIIGLFGSPRFSNGKQGENCGNSDGILI